MNERIDVIILGIHGCYLLCYYINFLCYVYINITIYCFYFNVTFLVTNVCYFFLSVGVFSVYLYVLFVLLFFY